jgi:ABC-type sulfate transport system permease subunit
VLDAQNCGTNIFIAVSKSSEALMIDSFVDIYRESSLASRLYFLFLMVVAVYTAVRFILSARELWFRPICPPKGSNEDESAHQLARAALKGLFPVTLPALAV